MFARIVQTTRCPFAPHANYIEVHCESAHRAWPEAVTKTAAEIRESLLAWRDMAIDMVAIEVSDPDRTGSLQQFIETVNSFARALSEDHRSFGPDSLMFSEQWRLWVEGIPVFFLTFAPFYPPDHPRHSPTGNAYIVLQLHTSFRRFSIHKLSPQGLRRLSERVQRIFERDGITYFAAITQGQPESLRVIKPITEADPPVKWWRP
jgi:hypothetical protein